MFTIRINLREILCMLQNYDRVHFDFDRKFANSGICLIELSLTDYSCNYEANFMRWIFDPILSHFPQFSMQDSLIFCRTLRFNFPISMFSMSVDFDQSVAS